VVADLAPVRLRQRGLEEVGGEDHGDRRPDHRLDRPEAEALEGEDPEGRGRGEQAADPERHPEQEVEADGGAEELGQVRRDRNHLGGQEGADHRPAGQALAADLGQVHAGRDAELRGEALEKHRDDVGEHDHPEQLVSELGTGRDVGCEVAWVDVGDRGDEGGTEEGEQAAEPTAAGVLAGEDAAGGSGFAGSPREGLSRPRRNHAT